jgi:transposase
VFVGLQSKAQTERSDVSLKSIFKKLLGVEKAELKSVDLVNEKGEAVIVARVKLHKRHRWRCHECRRKAKVYDQPYDKRRWRAQDVGGARAYIAMGLPRVDCPEHGIHSAWVPWAEHKARFTRSFDHLCAWLARHLSKSAASQLLRVDWKSMGGIIKRVVDGLEVERGTHRFDNLIAIGVDETSYKRGHKYLTIIVNHENGEVIWAAKGHGKDQLNAFFDLLSAEQRAVIKLVSADGARWIAEVVADRCPDAVRVMDPFHVVSWATDALDEVRKEVWREAKAAQKDQPKRGRGRPKKGEEQWTDTAGAIKGARFSLWKNPEDLTCNQQAQLEMVAISNPRLHRAYLLKEGLRLIFHMPKEDAAYALDRWLSWAQRCHIKQFVELGRKVRRHKEAILAAIGHGLSNARIEAINNKIKLCIRTGYGFRNIDNLIALIMLRCTSLPISLPHMVAA